MDAVQGVGRWTSPGGGGGRSQAKVFTATKQLRRSVIRQSRKTKCGYQEKIRPGKILPGKFCPNPYFAEVKLLSCPAGSGKYIDQREAPEIFDSILPTYPL